MIAAQTIAAGNAGTRLEAGELILEARQLRKVYGDAGSQITILDGVNLEISAGEMIAIVGPSGTGKSTFLHLLGALDTPTGGAVYFNGSELESGKDEAVAEYRNRRIGFVWQRHHLMADFTAAENVAMPLLMRGCPYIQALKTAEG